MRMAINPILMKPQIVSSYIPLIDSIVGDFMRNIPHIQNEKGEMPENFQDYLNRWSLESITAISLEKRLGLMNFKDKNESGMKIAKAVRKIILLGMEFEMKPSAWRYYETKRFKELLQAYDDLTEYIRRLFQLICSLTFLTIQGCRRRSLKRPKSVTRLERSQEIRSKGFCSSFCRRTRGLRLSWRLI